MQTLTATSKPAGIGVHLEKLRRTFDNGVIALDGIDLDVAPGEFLAILGPSGCGKSTLLRLIARLDQPESGTVRLVDPAVRDNGVWPVPTASSVQSVQHGRDDRGTLTAQDDTRKADIAYVFQDAHLLPWRNVLHNVALPLELMGVPTDQRIEASRAAVAQVGLAEAVDRFPNQLSGGQRMRVSLARAIVTNPRLLLLDEPFAALDEITRQRLDEQLRDLWAARGMTVLFVTHSTTEAAYLAERAVVMTRRPGRIIEDHRIELPRDRAGSIRGTSEFAREIRVLYEALERGET